MKIAVCNDSIIERSSIYEMLVHYCNSHSIEARIELFESGKDFLTASPVNQYTLVLIDGMMKGLNNIADISHYLGKPVTYQRLSDALDFYCELLIKATKSVTVLSERTPIQILHQSILYIEVTNALCAIHTAKDVIKTYRPLKELEDELPSPPFLRCHRSYLLNMDYVEVPLERDFQLKDDSVIPISKKSKTRIKEAYFRYLYSSQL